MEKEQDKSLFQIFWEGFTSLGFYQEMNISLPSIQESIAKDWQNVGDDIRNAINSINEKRADK